MQTLFGILGMLGGILCACGDLLLDMKGRDNKELGKYGLINSKWTEMSPWRFKASILLASLGVPLYFLGITQMSGILAQQCSGLGLAFFIVGATGSIGGLFIHIVVCLLPLVYKKVLEAENADLGEKIINEIYEAIMIPFWIMYLLLVGVTSLLLAVAVFSGVLAIPTYMLFLTPLFLLAVGLTLRKLKHSWFYDLPGIVMPSMGLGMIGLMVLIV